MTNLIHLRVRNRDGVIFEDDVKAVSSVNDKGPFDVLPRHANFITLIKNYIVIRKKDNSKQDFKVDSGLLQATNNTVVVFIGIVNLSKLYPRNPAPPQTPSQSAAPTQ